MAANFELRFVLFQADIFSLGVTFYELVTQGKKPFGDSPYQCELDAAAISKRTVKPLSSVGCPHWPDMQNIIVYCLQSQPGKSLDLLETCSSCFARKKERDDLGKCSKLLPANPHKLNSTR